MQLPYSDELNTGYLARLFDNTSECYKLFWFKAIVMKIKEGKTVLSYEELVDRMIVDAWYMVTEYHLNLGPRDTLENLIILIKEKNPGLKSSEKETVILDYLATTNDKEIVTKKKTLTYNVPYRLQAPFLKNVKGKTWDVPKADLVYQINQENKLIYYFETVNGLDTRIVIQEDWAEYIRKNFDILIGWINYNLINYLQRRNPSVPGIADKLSPPDERKLDKVKKYWKLILSFESVREIYNDQVLTDKDISIDHFVPWSYVAHDELWNLSPTTRSINSSKSNNLPDWDVYFEKLARVEFQSYKLKWNNEIVRKEFEKCAKEHINNNEIRYRIYDERHDFESFNRALESVMRPVYDAARDCGFSEWEYKGVIL